MTVSTLLLILAALAVVGFIFGRSYALSRVGGNIRELHSLPQYYGSHVALTAFVPAAFVLLIWLIGQPIINSMQVSGQIDPADIPQGRDLSLVMTEVYQLARGLEATVASGAMNAESVAALTANDDVRTIFADAGVALAGDVRPSVLAAAQELRMLQNTQAMWRNIIVLVIAGAGFAYALRQIDPTFRARRSVETAIRVLLILASSVAILTTVGIIASLIFNTIEFFRIYPAADFFFGLTWQPSFQDDSNLGILPLLWGTLYISLVALAVAVPIGLFAAIYLAEYASPSTRAFVKPLLEILAGIPTIVYGLFALLTVGPVLVSVFGQGGALGVTWMGGGTAVMTAGLVMGIMLIPFVSSLSDDIINAVPQAMRDGSYGLGATQSETIKSVIIPAALPGIVGAILLAASRAIGETMIVVLGAGAAARLSLNPFEAMTTVTAKIVSQLTGDVSFGSPEAMVAFALGMSLFVITLCLNVLALRIVRKYREQYE
ncbi:MAG: phosphate ABC transporter permease subunit PstC [Planktomarina sp.]